MEEQADKGPTGVTNSARACSQTSLAFGDFMIHNDGNADSLCLIRERTMEVVASTNGNQLRIWPQRMGCGTLSAGDAKVLADFLAEVVKQITL